MSLGEDGLNAIIELVNVLHNLVEEIKRLKERIIKLEGKL